MTINARCNWPHKINALSAIGGLCQYVAPCVISSGWLRTGYAQIHIWNWSFAFNTAFEDYGLSFVKRREVVNGLLADFSAAAAVSSVGRSVSLYSRSFVNPSDPPNAPPPPPVILYRLREQTHKCNHNALWPSPLDVTLYRSNQVKPEFALL